MSCGLLALERFRVHHSCFQGMHGSAVALAACSASCICLQGDACQQSRECWAWIALALCAVWIVNCLLHALRELETCGCPVHAEDSCNFALNIYNEGSILSIVVDAGSHGTHVAGITAAFHEHEPHLNGIAPGAACPAYLLSQGTQAYAPCRPAYSTPRVSGLAVHACRLLR